MSTPNIGAGFGPDVECWFGMSPQTDFFGSQTAGSPLFQISQLSMRQKNAPSFVSTLSHGEKEQSLESPVVEWSLPYSQSNGDECAHETIKVLLSGGPIC